MRNPIFNRQHLKEYFLYGLMAAILYMIPVIYFLSKNLYSNLYFLYIGNALFMGVIFFHAYKLVFRPYESERSISMVIAGTLSSIAGVFFSVIFVLIAMLCFFPDLFSYTASNNILGNAPVQNHHNYPTGLLFMLMINVTLCNFGCGSFASLLTAYGGKQNQKGDKPADLSKNIPEN